jgi:signal transduction histidine kinase
VRTVIQQHAPTHRWLAVLHSGLSPRRQLIGALTGLVVLPLLTVGLIGLRGVLNLPSQMLLYLLAIVLVALLGGLLPALGAVVAASALLSYYLTSPLDEFAPPNNAIDLVVFFLIAGVVSSVVDLAARHAREAARSAAANAESRHELHVLAEEQAALRRIATLVARGVPAAEVFPAVAEEAGRVLGADAAIIVRLDPDGATTVLARVGGRNEKMSVGSRAELAPSMSVAVALRTGRPARRDDYAQSSGGSVDVINRTGLLSSVATPIIVEGRLWGAIGVGTRRGHLPPDTEQRITGFSELLGTATANAQNRDELTASRARIVTAADNARRRLERDLHDGIQQRLISISLAMRLAQSNVPANLAALHTQIGRAAEELDQAIDELRENSRGIHPAILSEGGLEPALRTLARRCAIPVELDIRVDARPPDLIEVAAYYVASEALTNTTKHASASYAHIAVQERDGILRLTIGDDGVGGADPARGSGLTGLRDRVEALRGSIDVSSHPGKGTLIDVELPLQPN